METTIQELKEKISNLEKELANLKKTIKTDSEIRDIVKKYIKEELPSNFRNGIF